MIAVHLRRQTADPRELEIPSPDFCALVTQPFLKTLEIAVSECGLTWYTATVLDLFDRSCVHQSPAAVNHEAQGRF